MSHGDGSYPRISSRFRRSGPADFAGVATLVSINIRQLVNGDGMERLDREVSLPNEMQGRWLDIDEPTSELVIAGGEVTCFGQTVAYDYKLIGAEDGALTVSLRIEDEAREDDFQRANITELVITPEGDLHAYNSKFASQFVRTDG